jgi:hypothetical protein
MHPIVDPNIGQIKEDMLSDAEKSSQKYPNN